MAAILRPAALLERGRFPDMVERQGGARRDVRSSVMLNIEFTNGMKLILISLRHWQ